MIYDFIYFRTVDMAKAEFYMKFPTVVMVLYLLFCKRTIAVGLIDKQLTMLSMMAFY